MSFFICKEMKPINVLALCDGMSCGQIALTELGVPINRYYASEIDKFAIKQTHHNFPRTIQLGNIENWREWDIDFKSIDLILAGTPCQGFSFAGKQLAFDDPRSRLFFVFVNILNHIRNLNPDVKFLLENVNMKKSHLEVISRYTGVFPCRINSNLVSAQNRDRWYWTNVKTKQVGLFGEVYSDIPQPKDRCILLRDILEKDVDEKYYLSDKMSGWLNKHAEKRQVKINLNDGSDKTGCLTATAQVKQNLSTEYVCIAQRGRNPDNPTSRKAGLPTEQRFEPNLSGKTNCLSTVAKDNLILQLGLGFNKGGVHHDKTPTVLSNSWEQNNLLCIGGIKQGKFQSGITSDFSQGARVYSVDHKSTTLNALGGGQGAKTGLYLDNYRIRRLTPKECARLQTIPDWYEWIVSDTQIYKQCGNGWTIEVIKHILSQWDLVNESVLTKAI